MVAERLVLDAATELLKLAINVLTAAGTTVRTSQLQFVEELLMYQLQGRGKIPHLRES